MVLVFGTVCLDRIRRVATLPRPGGYVEIRDERDALGGEAANTASALLQWRVEVVLAGNAVGSGPDAERLRLLVLEKGLSDEWIAGGAAPPPVCHVYVSDDGDRTMFGAHFAQMLPPHPLDRLPFVPGAWFTAETNMRRVAEEAAYRAHAAGMRVYAMDFHHAEGVVPPGSIGQFSTDWVGERGNVTRNLAWVDAWSDHNRSTAVLTDGAHGVYLSHAGGPAIAFPAFPSPRLVDSTGAGDVFRAGVLRTLDAGGTLGAGLAFGAAAASLKVGTLGASDGVPEVAEVEAHAAAYPEVATRFAAAPGPPDL